MWIIALFSQIIRTLDKIDNVIVIWEVIKFKSSSNFTCQIHVQDFNTHFIWRFASFTHETCPFTELESCVKSVFTDHRIKLTHTELLKRNNDKKQLKYPNYPTSGYNKEH